MQRILRDQARKYAFDWRDQPLLRVQSGETFEIDEGILHFPQGDQQGLAVGSERLVIAAAGGLIVRLVRTAPEDRSGDSGSEGEHPVFPIEKPRDVDGLESAARSEAEIRVERRFRDPDFGAGGAEILLGGAHVGAAVEDLRGKSGADVGKGACRAALADGKSGWGRPAKHGEGVFRRAALALDEAEVVVREFEFRAGAARGDVVVQTRVGAGFLDIERVLAAFDGALQNRGLRIETTQEEILPRHFRGDAEPLGIEERLRGGGLGG